MEDDQSQQEEHSMSSLDLQDEFQPIVKLEEEEIYVQIKEEEFPTEISTGLRDGSRKDGQFEEELTTLQITEGGIPVHMLQRNQSGKSSRWDISLEHLISMVHARPELWDTECPRYSDRYWKKKVWDEVCAMLTPDWQILSERQRKQRAKDIQTRWRSARDRYRRDLNESQGKGIPGIQKKKPYVFFKDLGFLKKSMEMREKNKNANNTEDDDDFFEPQSQQPNLEDDSFEKEVTEVEEPTPAPTIQILPLPPSPVHPISHPTVESPIPVPKVSKASKKHKLAARPPDEFECKIMDIMASMQDKQKRFHEEQRQILVEGPPEVDLFQNMNDDDVTFLRSLLPYFKRAPENKKLDLRIGVLNIVSQYVDGSMYENSPPPSSVETQYSDHSISGAFLPSQPTPTGRYSRGTYGNLPATSSSYSHVSSTSTSFQTPHPGQHRETAYTYSTSPPSSRPYMQDL
ncbi:uncharacterized protein [Hyperolius riggenbachi]|uniref:uncharacterized protein isoform X2 n=1 Tax=Hyperolius riggenbachi TaxID=752182 RepID=UPI0035A2B359